MQKESLYRLIQGGDADAVATAASVLESAGTRLSVTLFPPDGPTHQAGRPQDSGCRAEHAVWACLSESCAAKQPT